MPSRKRDEKAPPAEAPAEPKGTPAKPLWVPPPQTTPGDAPPLEDAPTASEPSEPSTGPHGTPRTSPDAPPQAPAWSPASPPPAPPVRDAPRVDSPMEMATPRVTEEPEARAAALAAAAAPRPAPPARRRSVEPCLAGLIDELKLKPAQAESLEQLLDEHEVHDLATARILDAEDFKEIGIKVGTRKKLLERLASSTSDGA